MLYNLHLTIGCKNSLSFCLTKLKLLNTYRGNSYKKIAEVVTKSTRKKFPQSWIFNILKRESSILPNEEIIRHNICNVELQPNICDI